ncbi:hypothetical protein ASE74_20095 [Pedobacter sp. Leaf216]|nr:hypothetical protein ASE74_20095 [Pedobacter sp. Leaf216]
MGPCKNVTTNFMRFYSAASLQLPIMRDFRHLQKCNDQFYAILISCKFAAANYARFWAPAKRWKETFDYAQGIKALSLPFLLLLQ